jgi:hypothetical protein
MVAGLFLGVGPFSGPFRIQLQDPTAPGRVGRLLGTNNGGEFLQEQSPRIVISGRGPIGVSQTRLGAP